MKQKPTSPVFLAILILASLCVIGWAAFGQSAPQTNVNAEVWSPPAAPAAPAAAPSPAAVAIAADVSKLVLDLFTLCAGTSWTGAVLTLYLAAKGIRTRTPLGQGRLAGLLNLLNLEAKPDAPATIPAKPQTAVPALPKT